VRGEVALERLQGGEGFEADKRLVVLRTSEWNGEEWREEDEGC